MMKITYRMTGTEQTASEFVDNNKIQFEEGFAKYTENGSSRKINAERIVEITL